MKIARVPCAGTLEKQILVGRQRKGEQTMILRDYVNERLDEGETDAVILGLQNNVSSSLADALNHVPPEDWHSEISNRQKESDGQTLIWLEGRTDPSYSIQE